MGREDAARRMSWTNDLGVACNFASDWSGTGEPMVFECSVPVKAVLAAIGRFGEYEYVIDPTFITNLKRLPLTLDEIRANSAGLH